MNKKWFFWAIIAYFIAFPFLVSGSRKGRALQQKYEYLAITVENRIRELSGTEKELLKAIEDPAIGKVAENKGWSKGLGENIAVVKKHRDTLSAHRVDDGRGLFQDEGKALFDIEAAMKQAAAFNTALRKQIRHYRISMQYLEKTLESLPKEVRSAGNLMEDTLPANGKQPSFKESFFKAVRDFPDRKAPLGAIWEDMMALYRESDAKLKLLLESAKKDVPDLEQYDRHHEEIRDALRRFWHARKMLSTVIGDLYRCFDRMLLDMRYDQHFMVEYGDWTIDRETRKVVEMKEKDWEKVDPPGTVLYSFEHSESWISGKWVRFDCFHQYRDVLNGAEKNTGWLTVESDYFAAHLDHAGLVLASKPYGKFSSETSYLAEPPLYSYVENPRFGCWKEDPGGKYWQFSAEAAAQAKALTGDPEYRVRESDFTAFSKDPKTAIKPSPYLRQEFNRPGSGIHFRTSMHTARSFRKNFSGRQFRSGGFAFGK